MAWQARLLVVSQLGLSGVAQVVLRAVELARLKRSLARSGLRESLGDGEYAQLFARQPWPRNQIRIGSPKLLDGNRAS